MGNANLSIVAKSIEQRLYEIKEFERKVANVRINFIYHARREEMPF